MAKATYKQSGVDLEIYRQSMSRLPRLLRRTHSPRVLPAEGGFAGLFQLDFSDGLFARRYKDPVLVSGTDGVGTKLKVAQRARVHNTVGIDLVAMCVNDVLCCGAEPLFFLDYVAMGRDDPALLESIVSGISDGCVESDMALIGGETAIMPDMYGGDDYDLAGFCVGVVERQKVIDGSAIVPGDIVLGVASSGLHSNGYSLVRKIVFEIAGLDVSDSVPKEIVGAISDRDSASETPPTTVGQLLLRPTTIYARPVRSILNYYKVKGVVHGIAHITGGGLHENLARILPPGVGATIDRGSWPMLPVFEWLQQLGEVEDDEMYRVFNMGVGLVLVVSPYYSESIQQQLARAGLSSWTIGRAVDGNQEVAWSATES
ncbi:MAG TPA: phosphoribosylformylglycinamidine cyclo-ligase [Lacipirellulaceae bacterium]|nr:phosphoribosylformylglycinamidine cyclo-ligase [Lacipirellulaceae bacterium]